MLALLERHCEQMRMIKRSSRPRLSGLHDRMDSPAGDATPNSDSPRPGACYVGCALALVAGALLVVSGCGDRQTEQPQASAPTTSAVPLRIAAPAEARLLDAIQSSWEGVSDQPIELQGVVDGDWTGAAKNADVVLLPNRFLGDAIAERTIIQLPTTWLEKTGGTSEFLPVLLDHQMRFGQDLYGLSLGSPVAVFAFGPSLSDQALQAATAAERWELFDNHGERGKGTSVEPLAEGYAAAQFLLRSCSRVERDWLFDRQTMRSRLADDPHYLAVLRQMKQRYDGAGASMTVAEVAQAILAGEATAAVVYAPADATDWLYLPIAPDERSLSIAPLQLPGEGLMACIASACRQSSQARQFIRWISGPDVIGTLASSSSRITPNRSSDAGGGGYTAAAVDTLSRRGGFRPTLRLRGASEYYQALDRVVRQCLAGEVQPEEALQQGSQAWDAITDRLGVDSQRDSWLLSQGLPPDRAATN